MKTIYYDLDARHRVEAGAVIIMDVNKPHLDASGKEPMGLEKSKSALKPVLALRTTSEKYK